MASFGSFTFGSATFGGSGAGSPTPSPPADLSPPLALGGNLAAVMNAPRVWWS